MVWGLVVVEGVSMVPVLAPGERVLVHYGADFAVGDIVLVDRGERIDVKRVTRVEGSHIYVEGDNAAASTDSRQYGAVSRMQILGRVVLRLPRWLRSR